MDAPKLGHGDHWLAALHQDDPRIADALATPIDAPEGVHVARSPLTEALDMVQVTARRRLVTAFPEPRATSLAHAFPRRLDLWPTRVEGWLTVEHEGAGALTLFPTDLAEHAAYYQSAGTRRGLGLELGALAYVAHARPGERGAPRVAPASREDARFLPDDYAFEGLVLDARAAGEAEVLDLAFQNGLEMPVVVREPTRAKPGDHVEGYLWLTGRRASGPPREG
ncbi:MAG: hypothetical protein QOE90_1334 [Thermoplasmata archaeon]|jgi:hypothetical protein|nr:hypothetical protein [Thermoplasmata archaeon]